jgi:hypothetical protein
VLILVLIKIVSQEELTVALQNVPLYRKPNRYCLGGRYQWEGGEYKQRV